MKKCPFCAEEIQDEAIKCRYCEGMLDKKQPEKRHLKTSFLIMAFVFIGPFALPLLWINPRFSQKTKIIVSVIVIIISYYLASMFIDSIKSVSKYYQQIFTPTL